MARKPQYRKVKKYFKSSRRYALERNRRKLVLRLVETGLSQLEIAEKLDVSERTVRRDVAKVKPYQERMFRHQVRLLQKEFDEKFEAEFVGKTPLEQLRILSRKMTERSKLLKMREYYHHQIYVTIDVDKVVYGFPEIRIWPQNTTSTYRMPLTVNFRYVKNKKTIPIRSMTLSYNSR